MPSVRPLVLVAIVTACALAATACSSSGAKRARTTSGSHAVRSLVVEPLAAVGFQGRARGPFLPAEHIFTLSNATNAALGWSATSSEPWLVLSLSQGALRAHASTDLWLTLDPAHVRFLAPGAHRVIVALRDGTARPGEPNNFELPIDLTVLPEAPGCWALEPEGEFQHNATVGDPLRGARRTYTLTNAGERALDWSATTSAEWLVLPGQQRGTLAAGRSTAIEVAIDPAQAEFLLAGNHVAELVLASVQDPTLSATRPVRLALDARPVDDGWSRFVPSEDTRTVYVSSVRGDDANDGLSAATAKKTLAAGVALLRSGHPDWLLLASGETWQESLAGWRKSGRSAREPMLVSSYGDLPVRPRLDTGTSDGLATATLGPDATVDHVAFVGLHLIAHAYRGDGPVPSGIAWRARGENVLFEDCLIERFGNGVILESLVGGLRDTRLRRSIVTDGWTTGEADIQGLYAWGVEGLTIEECVFDHNGWSEGRSDAGPTTTRHDIYVDAFNTSVRVEGNIIANGASHGLQLRCGGAVQDNLFVLNGIALRLGGEGTDATQPIDVEARRNVILDGRDIDFTHPRGWGIEVACASSGAIAENLILNQRGGSAPFAIILYDGANPAGLRDLVLEDNVVRNWGGPLLLQGAPPIVSGIVLRRNALVDQRMSGPLVLLRDAAGGALLSEENWFFSRTAPESSWMQIGAGLLSLADWQGRVGDSTSRGEAPAWHDPERTLGTYHATLAGTASTAAFLAAARAQSKARWRLEYTARAANAWIRAGFVAAPVEPLVDVTVGRAGE